MRDEFYFPSKDGNTEIHTMEWKPEGEVKAVVQLCHGMVEYIKRYDEFAEFLCSHGYYVVGNDHLGSFVRSIHVFIESTKLFICNYKDKMPFFR